MTEFEKKHLAMLHALYSSFNGEYQFGSREEQDLFESWFNYFKTNGLVGRCPTLHEVGIALDRFKEECPPETVVLANATRVHK